MLQYFFEAHVYRYSHRPYRETMKSCRLEISTDGQIQLFQFSGTVYRLGKARAEGCITRKALIPPRLPQ